MTTYLVLDAPGHCGDWTRVYEVFDENTSDHGGGVGALKRARRLAKDPRVIVVASGGTHHAKGDRISTDAVRTLLARGDWKKIG